MKINEKYKVREMAGEHVVIMQGHHGKDLTKIISLNESALYLWRAIEGREFTIETIAQRDASTWISKLDECGLLEQ